MARRCTWLGCFATAEEAALCIARSPEGKEDGRAQVSPQPDRRRRMLALFWSLITPFVVVLLIPVTIRVRNW